MHAALLTSDDPGWTEALAVLRHDIYHLAPYVEFATQWQEPGAPWAFVASENGRVFFTPLILRPIPEQLAGRTGWFDATGPRGYPGPILGPGAVDPHVDFVQRAVASMTTTLQERRVVSAYVRLHPLLSPAAAALGGVGTLVEHGETVSIDLSRSEDVVWRDTRENHRRAIERARRLGYTVRVDESWARLDDFIAIYAATMDRLGASEQSRLSHEYVTSLRLAVESSLWLFVVEIDGDLAAGAMLSEVDGIVEYHLSGIATDHIHNSPTKLLIHEAGRWARARGDRVLHLAGSLRQDDSLIHFKRGFSPLRHDVRSWRLTIDENAFRELVLHREQLDGPAPHPARSDPDAYFPAYRRPPMP